MCSFLLLLHDLSLKHLEIFVNRLSYDQPSPLCSFTHGVSCGADYLCPCRSDKTVLATAGCQTDVITLRRMLSARLTQYAPSPHYLLIPSYSPTPLLVPARYEHGNNKVMSTSAAAQLLSVTLYYRRFFPYYSFCLMAGLDEEGRGACYGYDAIGSFKRDDYGAMGSGQNFIMPLLDNLVRGGVVTRVQSAVLVVQ